MSEDKYTAKHFIEMPTREFMKWAEMEAYTLRHLKNAVSERLMMTVTECSSIQDLCAKEYIKDMTDIIMSRIDIRINLAAFNIEMLKALMWRIRTYKAPKGTYDIDTQTWIKPND